MKKNVLLISGLVFIIYILFSFVSPVSAVTLLGEDFSCVGKAGVQACGLIDILRLGRAVVNFILRYVGVVALIFFLYGGIVWITSSGNPERIKKGKGVLVGSLIGLLIVFFAWQIVNLVICATSQGEIKAACQIFGRPWHQFPEGAKKEDSSGGASDRCKDAKDCTMLHSMSVPWEAECKGLLVKGVKETLNDKKCGSLVIDDCYDRDAAEAVKKFQETHGRSTTGKLDYYTFLLLNDPEKKCQE